MQLLIDGTDITEYIAYQGLKWQRYDVEAPQAGRSLDGIMHRGRISTKIRLDVKCHILKANELSIVLNAILPEYVMVEYDDPMYGRVTKKMYSNNNPASYCILKPDGTEYWSEISFPLIEV